MTIQSKSLLLCFLVVGQCAASDLDFEVRTIEERLENIIREDNKSLSSAKILFNEIAPQNTALYAVKATDKKKVTGFSRQAWDESALTMSLEVDKKAKRKEKKTLKKQKEDALKKMNTMFDSLRTGSSEKKCANQYGLNYGTSDKSLEELQRGLNSLVEDQRYTIKAQCEQQPEKHSKALLNAIKEDCQNTNYLSLLLTTSADPFYAESVTQLTPIHAAASSSNVKVLNLLLKDYAGPKENLNVRDSIQFTPLEYALRECSNECAWALLDAGAAANCVNTENKESDLHAATRVSMSPEIITKLVASGADTNYIYDGKTARAYAVYMHNENATQAIDEALEEMAKAQALKGFNQKLLN